MQLHQFRYFAGRSSRLLLLVFLRYVSCYFLMMDWRVLAYDPTSGWTGESCYYMTRIVRVHGDYSVYSGSACWANWLFRPIDSLLYHAKAAIGFRVFRSGFWTIWLFAFGLNLLLPFSSVILRGGQSLRKSCVQIFLSLAAAGWYCVLILLYHLVRQGTVNVLLGKSLAIVGAVLAAAALYWITRAGGCRFVVPLVVATVLGTIWLLASLPCVTPYM